MIKGYVFLKILWNSTVFDISILKKSKKMFSSSNKLYSKCTENTNEKKFNFNYFLNSLKSSISGSDSDIDLQFYLIAYDQLYNFFLLLGGAFQFVAADVKSKIRILNGYREEELRKNQSVQNFLSVKAMVSYEKMNNLLLHPTYISGCRTLLRLHRGLDFFRKFLRELYGVHNETKLCGVARKVYDETLAEFHTFVVRNTARVAMQFLPTRLELLNKISDNVEQVPLVLESFPDALEIMDIVYDRIQFIYIENELLHLP